MNVGLRSITRHHLGPPFRLAFESDSILPDRSSFESSDGALMYAGTSVAGVFKSTNKDSSKRRTS